MTSIENMSPSNFLDLLRKRTAVDCDTLDLSICEQLGPFHDCTSNQAIAFGELQNPAHEDLLKEAVNSAKNLCKTNFDRATPAELAVEISMVSLSLKMLNHTSGYVHVQINPFLSYSTPKILNNARRLKWLARYMDHTCDTSRICIKIPSTWEGLSACRTLQSEGIATLATTLFAKAQVVMAGEVGCRYIAPYLHELKVQIEPGYTGGTPLLDLCVAARDWYRANGLTTRVLPASLTTIDEVMSLSGVDHITIAPKLLRELADTGIDELPPASLFDSKPKEQITADLGGLADDEARFRMAVTGEHGGDEERKLSQAINIFCDFQQRLERMMLERGVDTPSI